MNIGSVDLNRVANYRQSDCGPRIRLDEVDGESDDNYDSDPHSRSVLIH